MAGKRSKLRTNGTAARRVIKCCQCGKYRGRSEYRREAIMQGERESELPCKPCEDWTHDQKIAEARRKYDPGPLFDEDVI